MDFDAPHDMNAPSDISNSQRIISIPTRSLLYHQSANLPITRCRGVSYNAAMDFPHPSVRLHMSASSLTHLFITPAHKQTGPTA